MLLREARLVTECRFHAYMQMDNHVHLRITPPEIGASGRLAREPVNLTPFSSDPFAPGKNPSQRPSETSHKSHSRGYSSQADGTCKGIGMKWQMFIGHAVFIGSILITVVAMLVSKVMRELRKRRSPLHGKQIGHLPGQQLLRRIDKASEEASFGYDVMVISLPMMFLIWSTLQINWAEVRFGINEALFLSGWALLFGYGFLQYQRHSKRKEQALDGLLAERVTGMQLNRLVARGCIVMHDLPCGDYNIDHVVVAPRGVFAIETKSYRKPKNLPAGTAAKVLFDGETLKFSDFSTTKPIEQSRRQAKSLSSLLRESLGEAIRVTPALALPGWWVDKTEAGKSSDVFVFTPMGRGCEWFTYGDELIPSSKRKLIAETLAIRYPPVS
ncbi:nuclease-related domain-containing protein [Vulcaniibacterium tengchongense]|uniref:Nuclease-like protein n=1 Tax=Vulcaniibacterium tengchongense TaxID=1273429 RepID=A0A3N4VXW8_9GAMM|nr:nuclease-related domain-containing protein [Vulcaniibacterium tengchongense]RPE81967.1 nuclease-like protein [Vulcaniibacterium tengchongense]